MKYRSLQMTVSVLAAALVLSACGGGGGGGGSSQQPAPKVQLSGTVSSAGGGGYNYKMFSAPGGTNPVADTVFAIPMQNGSLDGWMMPSSKSATINPATGGFSLSLEKSFDWLLMLVNSTATGTNRYVGSMALNAGGSDSMLSMPATNSILSTMNLGTVSRDQANGDALTSKVVGTADFSLSASQITAMAKTDKLFRNAMNLVNNYETYGNGPGKWYQLRPDFAWSGTASLLTTAGALSSVPTFTYTGMNFQLDQNVHNAVQTPPADTAFMNNVCNTKGYVALYPPASAGVVTIGTRTYDYAHPIMNSGATCTTINNGTALATDYNGIYATNAYDYISFSVIDRFTTTAVPPSGFWEWKENGVVKAAFDLANINPPITATGRPIGFIPVYKINVDGTKKITSVDIAWFYSADGITYTAVAQSDLAVLKHFVGYVEAKFDVTWPLAGGTRRTCEMYIDISTDSTVTTFYPNDPAHAATCKADALHQDWYFNAAPGVSDETNITLGGWNAAFIGIYSSGGYGYFFGYN